MTSILFVGDMHLGTHLTRIPAGVGRAADYGPGAAWDRVVTAAIDLDVDAVALAGDVVNRSNELFEARRPLDRGLGRLAEAGIPVLAVAGNHDTDTLPTLARGDGRLILLGEGGTWSAHEIRGADGPPVRVVGWSFPRPDFAESPLATAVPPDGDGVVTFGLLHGDLDQTSSPYAPVGTAELRGCGYDGWFLGHIHTPGPVPDDGRPFYLGSLTGLDPTETGVHGPLLVTVGADGAIQRRRLPLAPLRWERLDLPCDQVDAPEDDLPSVLTAGLDHHLTELDLEPGAALGVRVTLTGATARPAAVVAAARALDLAALVTEIHGVTVFLDRVDVDVRGQLDVAALARNRDPAGLLARRVLVLEGDPEWADEELLNRLLNRARAAVDRIDRFAGLQRLDGGLDDDGLRGLAAREARRALDGMVNAGEASP